MKLIKKYFQQKYNINYTFIINPKIDKYGNFSGLLFDKYDFAFLIKKARVWKNRYFWHSTSELRVVEL